MPPRQPLPPRLPPERAAVPSGPPEELDDSDLVDEFDLVESIEPLASLSVSPDDSEAPRLSDAPEALEPASLPRLSAPAPGSVPSPAPSDRPGATRLPLPSGRPSLRPSAPVLPAHSARLATPVVPVPSVRPSAPPAFAATPPPPGSTRPVSDFFEALPDDDGPSVDPAVDDAPTQMLDAASLDLGASDESTQLVDAASLDLPTRDAPAETPAAETPAAETPAAETPAVDEPLADEIELDFSMDDELDSPPTSSHSPPPPLAAAPRAGAAPELGPDDEPSMPSPDRVTPEAGVSIAAWYEAEALSRRVDEDLTPEPGQPELAAPESPATDALEVGDDDFALDLEMEDLVAADGDRPSLLAITDEHVGEEPAPPTTLEALEAELFADIPRVDLGAALPPEAGFADLALADDELDEMFRDLQVSDGFVEASVPAPVLGAGGVKAPEVDDFVGFYDVVAESESEVEVEGDDEEMLLIDGDEEEVDLDDEAPADRGAMLAATVTSRRREHEASEALWGVDARAEAQARVDLLADEAGQDDSYTRAAEGLTVVAETLDGVFGDPERARNFAERATALAPEVISATRLLRRMDLVAGNVGEAYRRILEELQSTLSPTERFALLRMAGELAARVDPEEAASHWDELAQTEGIDGALAAVFAAAQRRDSDALAAALARWSDQAGAELAASLSVARARLVESRGSDDALEAIRDAVRRDPSAPGAWIAMARIAFAQVRPDVASEALVGLSRIGGAGALAMAAEALSAATRAIAGHAVPPTVLDDDGASAWLMARAQEETGVDAAQQIAAAVERATGEVLAGWRRREGALEDGEVGWYHALERAITRRDEPEIARCAAGLLGGEGSALAGLLAEGEPAREAERAAAGESNPLAAMLDAASGAPRTTPREGDPYAVIEAAEELRRGGEGRVEEALRALTEVALVGAQPAAASFAARAVASLAGDPAQVVEMLRIEAMRSRDARRAAASRLIAAALGAAYGVTQSADGLVEAAEALPGDFAVAELAALFALRGELDPELGAELLDKASASGDDRAHHTAAVRAALRRAAVDPDSATEAVWRAWMRCPKDASLGTLVLRSPAQPAERVAAVLRAQIDAAHAEGAQGASAAIAEGLLLAAVLEQSGRFAEAAQAVARARTLSLEDPTLVVAEERLWLKAGMFAEVAERAFEQLRAAREDHERVAAYERLAELDRSYRGDIASSVLSFQAILEVAPGHIASQRTLERYLIEQGRSEELLQIYQHMIDHLTDPEDTLAYAHVAARAAANLGDADIAAAGPILRGVFARDLTDRRLTISLEAEARRSGDAALFAEVMLRGAQFAGNEQERATCFVRAGEGFLSSGDRARAREAFEYALAVDPTHVVALQHAAIERAHAGDARAAAEACETLGRKLKTARHAATFLGRAAEHLRESDPTRGLSLAREALARDPENVEAWTLASGIARALGDAQAEMEIVAMRADAPPSGERADALTLHLRAAELSLSLGDRARARAELRRVVELDPSRIEALRTLAQLTWDDEDWTSAADASIRLAKLTQEPAERAEMLFRLGEIFDLRLPDASRAEAAYRRAIQVSPDDIRAHERLVALYEREGEGAKEFEYLQALTARTMPGPERISRLLRVAELAEGAMSDPGRAELAFEGARREAPMDVVVLRRFADFLERSAASEARQVLLERAGAEARRGVDLAPRDPAAYDMLIEVRRLRRDDSGARSIASVALSVGARSRLIDAYGTLTPEDVIGARAIVPGAVELLAPPTVPTNLRTLLSQAQDLLAASAVFEPASEGVEPLGDRPHTLRGLVDEWSELLGMKKVEIFIARDVPELARPVGGTLRGVIVPPNVIPSLGARFAVARAMLLDAVGLGLVVRVPPRDLALHLAALLRQFEPMHRPPNLDASALDEHARAMTRVFPRARHAELSPIAFQVIERGPIDASALLVGTWELGNRLALLATEDMSAAISLLSPTHDAALEQLASTTALGRLLRVTTSDRFAEARRVAERGAVT